MFTMASTNSNLESVSIFRSLDKYTDTEKRVLEFDEYLLCQHERIGVERTIHLRVQASVR